MRSGDLGFTVARAPGAVLAVEMGDQRKALAVLGRPRAAGPAATCAALCEAAARSELHVAVRLIDKGGGPNCRSPAGDTPTLRSHAPPWGVETPSLARRQDRPRRYGSSPLHCTGLSSHRPGPQVLRRWSQREQQRRRGERAADRRE